MTLFSPNIFIHFKNFISEGKNQYLTERCNRLSQVISKCDELSENSKQLSVLAMEQRQTMQLLKIKCKEMVKNIEKSNVSIHFELPSEKS